ncbi:MAG: trypsin-like peptidase domain-containing protein [Isosphaeraceae bacterium]|nr:trypsin-like peptidase domain-containing protein [Isosphaeraceae bacterium]
MAEAVARARDQVLTLEFTPDEGASARRVATGVVVRDDGRGRDVLSVRVAPPPSGAPVVARDAEGRKLLARWVADDPETGLTLLRVDDDPPRPATPLLPLPASPPRLGSHVLVIGNPFGLGHSVTRGSISGLDRRLDLGARPLGGLIQIDAAFHPGDSGALVVNLRGEWLGLVRSGLAPPGADAVRDHDLGFALPARDALWVADRLRTRGRVDRAYLGIRIALRPSNEGPGAVLDSVLDDTPAARAGLKAGDRVVTFDGQAIASPRDLTDRLDRTSADADAVVDYYRGAARDRRIVRTASRPQAEREREPERHAAVKTDDPRVLKERLERLERRIGELERARPKDLAPPQEAARADSPH